MMIGWWSTVVEEQGVTRSVGLAQCSLLHPADPTSQLTQPPYLPPPSLPRSLASSCLPARCTSRRTSSLFTSTQTCGATCRTCTRPLVRGGGGACAPVAVLVGCVGAEPQPVLFDGWEGAIAKLRCRRGCLGQYRPHQGALLHQPPQAEPLCDCAQGRRGLVGAAPRPRPALCLKGQLTKLMSQAAFAAWLLLIWLLL